MNESTLRKGFGVALVGVVVAVVASLVINWTKSVDPATQTRQASNVDANGNSNTTHTQKPPERAAVPIVASTAPSLSEEFAKLVDTGSPIDAFHAYDIATRCAESQADEKAAEMQAPGERSAETNAALKDGTFRATTVANCGDLTSAQVADRVKYLTQAANAGVPMAALRLVEQGPWGDQTALTTRPDDPAVLEWRRQMVGLIELAAGKGDYAAMDSLSTMYRTGSGILGERDPGKALMYATAKWEAYQQATGRTSAFAKQEVSQLAAGLTPQEAAAATTAGHQFAIAAITGARQ